MAFHLPEPQKVKPLLIADDFVSLITRETCLGPLLLILMHKLESSSAFLLRMNKVLSRYWDTLSSESLGETENHVIRVLEMCQSYIASGICSRFDGSNRSALVTHMASQIPGETAIEKAQRLTKTIQSIVKDIGHGHDDFDENSSFTSDHCSFEEYGISDLQLLPSEEELQKHQISDTCRISESPSLRDLFFTGCAYAQLRLSIRRIAEQDQMTIVRQELLSGLPFHGEAFYSAEFHIDWDIKDYASRELSLIDGDISLDSVLTITGGLSSAFASTCAEYMKWLWPDSELNLLQPLTNGLRYGSHRESRSVETY